MRKIYVASTADPRRPSRRVILGTYPTAEQAKAHLATHLLAWYYGEYKETTVRPSFKTLLREYERETGGRPMVAGHPFAPKEKVKR